MSRFKYKNIIHLKIIVIVNNICNDLRCKNFAIFSPIHATVDKTAFVCLIFELTSRNRYKVHDGNTKLICTCTKALLSNNLMNSF